MLCKRTMRQTNNIHDFTNPKSFKHCFNRNLLIILTSNHPIHFLLNLKCFLVAYMKLNLNKRFIIYFYLSVALNVSYKYITTHFCDKILQAFLNFWIIQKFGFLLKYYLLVSTLTLKYSSCFRCVT